MTNALTARQAEIAANEAELAEQYGLNEAEINHANHVRVGWLGDFTAELGDFLDGVFNGGPEFDDEGEVRRVYASFYVGGIDKFRRDAANAARYGYDHTGQALWAPA